MTTADSLIDDMIGLTEDDATSERASAAESAGKLQSSLLKMKKLDRSRYSSDKDYKRAETAMLNYLQKLNKLLNKLVKEVPK